MATVSSDPFGGKYSNPPEETVAKPAMEKVVTGRVTRQKKPLGKRFMDIFVTDSTDLKTYFFQEVVVPGVKNAFMYCLDGIQGAVEMKLFGTVTKRHGSYTSYNTVSTNYGKATYGNFSQPVRTVERGRSSMDVGQIVLESKGEADMVLDRLLDQIDQYGRTTVADLYELVGITENFTDRNFGWKNLSTADVRRVRGGGYALILPAPISLK